MGVLSNYYRSSQGKKVVMAITGLILFLYVLAHMAGNLQLYVPSPAGEPGFQINQYAKFLHSDTAKPLLWTARVVLFVSVVLHILAATQLTVQNWGSRGGRYLVRHWREADIAARTMIWSGPVIAAFVIFHILHLTTGSIGLGFEEIQAYQNLVHGFRVGWVSAFYMLAVILLGTHFWHGLWSWFQTLGWNQPAWNRGRRVLSAALTILVVVGDLSFPIAVLTGLVGRDVA